MKAFATQWEVLGDLDGTRPLMATTMQGYENLGRTMADIIRWMREASFQLEYYRNGGKLDAQKDR